MKIHDSNHGGRVRLLTAGLLAALLAPTPFTSTRGKVFKLVPP